MPVRRGGARKGDGSVQPELPFADPDDAGLKRRRSLRTVWARVARIRPESVAWWMLRWAARLASAGVFASIVARAWPYRTTVGGVPFRVQATLFARSQSGLSVDTTLGSWRFPHLSGLPIGVHVAPVNVDLLRVTRSATPNTSVYVDQLRSDFAAQLPRIGAWLAGEILLGALLGLVVAIAAEMAWSYLRQGRRRTNEVATRVRQVAAGLTVVVLVGVYGGLTYNSSWARQSRLTGTLAALQLFPAQLKQYYQHQSKAYDALASIVGIQAALDTTISEGHVENTAYNIMFISDIHLAAVYPLIASYAQNFNIKLIVNTGDESEFGSAAEMTPTFIRSIATVTAKIPMIWIAGNHDSPAVARIMAGIQGVTVLGLKVAEPDGSYGVSAGSVSAMGLTIAGVPDPRVYGAKGAYGADDPAVVDPLERSAADTAVAPVKTGSQSFDIFATHEPVAADRIAHDLPGRIRQTNAGHLHAQNPTSDIQRGDHTDLTEGSTGAGGLDNINRSADRPPIEFSVESVAADCQFTKVLRFQLRNSATPLKPNTSNWGDDVSVSTVYLTPQQMPSARTCSTADGIGTPVGLS